jgi:hypothetical protein
MISIRSKDYNQVPDRLLSDGAIRQIETSIQNKSGSHCDGYYYRADDVRNKLKAYSLGKTILSNKDKPKCFYCESQGEHMLVLEVEHYRPKDGLSEKDLVAGQSHDGYYWLGNEWSNLLLSCSFCNGVKGTRFPILNNQNRITEEPPPINIGVLDRTNYIMDSTRLLSEEPVLLNPEYDTPEDHLTYDTNGHISNKNGSYRGEQSIKILHLDRDTLLLKRQEILKEFLNDIKVLVKARNSGRYSSDGDLEELFNAICKKIIYRRSTDVAYTSWGRYLNTHIEKIFVEVIPSPYKQNFRNAYMNALNAQS